jgi:pseudomonalisin
LSTSKDGDEKIIPSFVISSYSSQQCDIAISRGIRQYTNVPITNTPSDLKQPAKTNLHPIQRPESSRKGRDLEPVSMHTNKKGSLKALYFGVLLGLLCYSRPLLAQGPKDRVLRDIDTSQMTVIRGNLHALVRPEFDQGRVDPAMPMRVTVMFKMTPVQQTDLDALLEAQQERGSPDYHRWLTPEQYGSRFGLSQGDINKVTGWLESAGFHVEGVPASQNMITFRGTAQQVESALRAEMHRYVVKDETHFANATEPSVPAALADVVLGFSGLNNFQLKPRALKMSPRFTSSVSGNHFITPADFATIYDVTPLYQSGFTGTGQKIVVVGQSDVKLSDIQAFRSNSGLPPNDPQPINPTNSSLVGLVVPGDADPGLLPGDNLDEANLDVEWAGAIAYNATVIFIVGDPVNGGGVGDAIRYAITTSPIPAPVISTSFGECEAAAIADGSFSFYQSLTQQANAEGITILGPSGDTGAADCDFNNPSNPTTTSTLGLAVDVPGALATVTSMGGTGFTEGADSANVYWKPAVGTDVISSARMYIPEGVWNDTDAMATGTSTSIGLAAGGGGSSTITPKPAWQAGAGVPNDGARDVPDISFSSSPLHDPYLFCTETKSLSPTCVNGFRNGLGGTLAAVGGTSVGPPLMAGVVALINQSTNQALGSGNINRILYPLAARLPSAFHDVQSGNNQVPFSPPCVTSTKIGYNALPGYDLATGLGSIDISNVVSNWTTVSPASTANAASSVDFSLSFAPSQLTVKRGACGSGVLVLTPVNGFSGTPRFSCTVAALGSTTCAIVPVGSAAFGAPRDFRELSWWGVAGATLAAAALVLAVFGRTQPDDRLSHAWPRLAPGFVLTTLLAIMIGCGGSSKSSDAAAVVNYSFAVQVPSTTPVSSGTVTVSAAIGGINHSAQMTVTTQ